MTPLTSSALDDAFAFAMSKHHNQVRKGTTIPYISHLMQVSGLVLENGGDADEAIAGLLHDVIEDQDVSPAEIEQRFGARVRDIVVACSDSTGTNKAPWRERKKAYIAHIAEANTKKSVRLVSACDKLHNARAILADYRSIGEQLWPRFNATSEQILWYYRGLADAFLAADASEGISDNRVPAELDRVVSEIERLIKSNSQNRVANFKSTQ